MADPATPTAQDRAETRELAARIVESVRNDERMPLESHAVEHYLGHTERPVFLRSDVEQLAFQLAQEVALLREQLNTPHTADFLEAVRIEAAHQRERWGSAHDAGKSEADWFWLLGYLAGKAIRPDADREKKLHHIITTAAACLNWHAHATGTDTAMRPGIEPPEETTDAP